MYPHYRSIAQTCRASRAIVSQQLLQTGTRRVLTQASDLVTPAATGHDGVDEKSEDTTLTPLLTKHAAQAQRLNDRTASLEARAVELQQEAPSIFEVASGHNSFTASKHHDLASFLAYATKNNLNTTTAVYKGTRFEYTVAKAVESFGIRLNRVGKAGDLGIDLIGHWTLPSKSIVPIFVQCKMTRPLPQVIRELEGACSAAPSGWQGPSKVALLASAHKASPGVLQALRSSPVALGFLQVSLEGVVKQFLWNTPASEHALTGLGIATRHAATRRDREADEAGHSLVLTWLGKPWAAS